MADKDIGVDAEIERVRLQILGSEPASPSASHAYVYAQAGGLFIKFPDDSVVGPFLAQLDVNVNGSFIGSAQEFDFIPGAGISILGTQDTPADPIEILITQGGAPRAVTTTDTIVPADSKILADAAGGSITLNLQTALDYTFGQIIWFKKITAGNTVTIEPFGSETIDGAANVVLSTQWSSVGIYTDGNEWFKV